MKWSATCGVLLALGIMGSGCTAPRTETGHDILTIPDKMISVPQLAERLSLAVELNSDSLIMLHSGENRVTVVPDAGGHASVNGKTVKTAGDFVQVGGVLFVPETMEGEVRALLKKPEPATKAPDDKAPDAKSPDAKSPDAKSPEAKPVPEPAKPPAPRVYRIVLDPGHGGEDSGTTMGLLLSEKDITLSVAQQLRRLLRADGFEVVMTRDSDTYFSQDDRAEIANRSRPDLFVSLHADAASTPAVSGFAVYTCREASAASRDAAKSVADALDEAGIEGMGMRQADYRVLVCSACPGILVELGYLSNSRDADMLGDRIFQARLAGAISEGIAQHLKR